MDKKFTLNLTLQIQAKDEDEAKKILCQKETLEMILEAIINSRDNIYENYQEPTNELIN